MAKKPARSSANDTASSEAASMAKPRARGAKLNSAAEGREKISNPPRDAMAARPLGEPTDEDIRARAYEMYLERGGQHGLDFDDWVRAERELRRKG